MSKLAQLVGVLFLVAGIGQSSFAHDNYGSRGSQGSHDRYARWVFLGQTTVNGHHDYDEIGVGRSEGRFERIQFRVSGSPVEFERIVVNYLNGEREVFDMRFRVPAGGSTGAIDLRGGERGIRSVELRYSRGFRVFRHSLPRVSLYGVDIVRRPAPYTFLGQTSVSGNRDHDIIGVGRNEGRFRSIQLRVHGGGVEFYRLIIRYSNGERDILNVRSYIPAGGQSRDIDLRGNERSIDEIEVYYGNSRSRGARVAFYAR